MENLHMKNKKALALALASVTMASAAVLTSYSATTASSVSAEEVVYRTEWVTVINGRSQERKTVFFEDGNQPISKHSTIEGFEFQRAYVEGGRKYYLFVEKGTKIEDYANDPDAPVSELNTQGYKTSDKDVKWRESAGNRYLYYKGNPVKGWASVDGKTYYFDSEGVMARGVIENTSERYYLDGQGVKKTGFIKVGEKTYYFVSDGARKTEIISENGKTYFVKDGVVTTGAHKVGANGISLLKMVQPSQVL